MVLKATSTALAINGAKAELLLSDVWTDVSSDCRMGAGFDITRGRADEAGRTAPGRCSFTLENTSGKYSPRNPSGAYYGSIGRNTPFRLSVPHVTDTFTRSVVDGWGAADTGQSWVNSGGLAADFDVGGSTGTHSVTSVNVSRWSLLDSPADIEQTVTFKFSAVPLTQPLRMALVSRYASSTAYYICWIVVNVALDVDILIRMVNASGETIVVDNTSTGITAAASTNLTVKFLTSGSTLAAKVWTTSGSEPTGWQAESTDTTYTHSGSAGVRSVLITGNTTALPVTFTYDNYASREIRFAGEVSSWPVRWDSTGTDVYVPTEAAGIMRRLGQGASNVSSQLRRYISSLSHVAYWPLEDDGTSGITSFASADTGGTPMPYSGVTLAAVSTLLGSLPLPQLATNASFNGSVSMTGTSWTVGFAAYVPAAPVAETEIFRFLTSGGTPHSWRVSLDSTGIILRGYDNTDTALAAFVTSFTYSGALIAAWSYIEVKATQNAANIDYTLSTYYAAGGSAGLAASDAGTMAPIGQVSLPSLGSGLDGSYIGHIAVRDVATGFGNMDGLLGGVAEAAGTRIVRLCGEAGIPVQIVGTAASTVSMGLQRSASLLDLLQDCADADGGILGEQRGEIGIRYVTSASLGNQTAVTLDYSANDLFGDIAPTEDDQQTRNDVTATRYGGSSAREVATTGALGTATVGTYSESVSVAVATDSQLRDQAAWRVHLGTSEDTRYPQLGVHLGRSVFTASESKTRGVTDLDVGALLAVSNPPAWLPPDTINQLVQGYREVIAEDGQRIAWNCSPAGPWRRFVLADSSATYGRLAYSGITLNEDLTTTETGADVAIATGNALVTTSAGDMPYDVLIGGERMTVTACSGASSPQTLTVTRSVNGVVKTHSTGAEVQIWAPAYLSLA